MISFLPAKRFGTRKRWTGSVPGLTNFGWPAFLLGHQLPSQRM